MRAMLERAGRYFRAYSAIIPLSGEPSLTGAEFVGRIRRAAGALGSLGFEAGDRFALVCRNDPRQAKLQQGEDSTGVRLGRGGDRLGLFLRGAPIVTIPSERFLPRRDDKLRGRDCPRERVVAIARLKP